LLVVIVNYRCADLVVDCLRSLAGQIGDVPGARVAVCENGSGDDSAEQLAEAIQREGWGDWVQLVVSERNLGFTGGNNLILREAMTASNPPDYFMLLNPDTIVHTGALAALRQAAQADPSLGIVGPGIVGPAGTTENSCFRAPSPLGELLRSAGTGAVNRIFGRDRGFYLEPPVGATSYDWTSFACAIIRREVLQRVGLLDEGFFMYFDDPDYCTRVRRAGWKIGHCPAATVTHLEGGSSDVPAQGRSRQRRARYYYVSRSRYFAKHFDGRLGLWRANLAWCVGRGVSLVRQAIGHAPPTCKTEWRDIWTNAADPIGKSEPGPQPPARQQPALAANEQ
jgi:GT2 family glycosyltransferase